MQKKHVLLSGIILGLICMSHLFYQLIITSSQPPLNVLRWIFLISSIIIVIQLSFSYIKLIRKEKLNK
jgi:hypothetical protein